MATPSSTDNPSSESGSGWRWAADFVQDTRRAVRALLRTPGFTIIGIVTIAVGVGATTSVFSLADALLLRPLPVPQPNSVLSINETRNGNVQQGPEGVVVPFARFEQYTAALRPVF